MEAVMDGKEKAALLARLLRDYGPLNNPNRVGRGLPYMGYEEPGLAGEAKMGAFNQAGGPMNLKGRPNPAYLEAARRAYEYENEMQRLMGRAGSVPVIPEN